MNEIHKAGALIFKGKKVMIVRPKDKAFFISPGGKYENGETAEQCLRRELQEELEVDLKSFKLYKDYHFAKSANSNYPLFLELYFVEINGEPKASSEIEVIEWMSKEDFLNKKHVVAPSFNTVTPDLIHDGFL